MKKLFNTTLALICVMLMAFALTACSFEQSVNVTLPTDTIGYTVSGNATATKGGSYSFTVEIDSAYEKGADFAVKVNGEAITEVDGKYTIANITDVITIEVVGVIKKVESVKVTLPTIDGCTVTGAATATKGGSYSFTVAIDAAYEKGADFAVKVNGEAITEADGKYTVANVAGDLTITVVGVSQKPTYSVTLPTIDGCTVTGAASVMKGESYSFTVAIDSTYEKGADFAVKVNGEAVTEADGKYTIANVADNLTITVEGVSQKPIYSVTLPTIDGCTVTGEASVMKGESYSFTVALDADNYKKGESFAVKVNGEPVAEVDGKYTVTNVSDNITITVDGVEKIIRYVNVTLPTETEGFTVTGDATAVKGENYTFTIAIAEGYKKGDDFVVTANGQPVAEVEGSYVIENVTSAQVVEVDGVVEQTLSATFTAESYSDALENTVESFSYFAEKYTFTVALTDHYKQGAADITVFWKTADSDEVELTANDEGIYSIDNPHKDITIIVKNVALNTYKVMFYRNAVVKQTIEVEAKSVLSEEQLEAAKTAILGEGETFVAWREDVTAPIVDTTRFSAYTKFDTAFGTEVEACPLTNGVQVELAEGEYSAAGFEKAYRVIGATTGIFNSNIDLYSASEVRFAIRIEKSWLLLDGWSRYIDEPNMWMDVVMTHNGAGKWNVSVTAPVHNNEGNIYTAEYQGATLSEILTKWYSDSEVTLCITEIRKTDIAAYGSVITTEAPAEGFEASTYEKTTPYGFSSVYYMNKPKGKKFVEIDVSNYSEIKFFFAVKNGWTLLEGWGAYAENGPTKGDWVPVTLINKEDGVWAITIEGKLSGGNAAGADTYTYTGMGSDLKAILDSWFTDDDAEVLLTEFRGIKKNVVELFGAEIGDVLTNITLDETASAPAGFEKAYKVDGGFRQEIEGKDNANKNNLDLSGYSTVKFALKSDAYFLIDGWTIYLKESQTGWVYVTMTNKGNNSWDVTVGGNVAGVSNPWTQTYTGTSIAEILADWYNGSNIYVTELRGELAVAE